MMFEPGASEDAARIEDYIRAIRQRWLIVLVAPLLLGIAASLYASSRTESYTADARIAVGPSPVGSNNANNLRAANLEREREEIESNAVAEAAVERLSVDSLTAADLLRRTSVSFRPDSEVLRVEVTDGDPDFAAEAANAIASTYVEMRQGASSAWYQTRLDSAVASLEAVDEQVEELEESLAELTDEQAILQQIDLPTPEQSARIRALNGEIDNLSSDLSAERVVRRNLSLDVVDRENEARAQNTAATLLREAVPPTSPDGISN